MAPVRSTRRRTLAAVDLVAALVREHGIDCDWEQRPAYAYTEPARVSQIEEIEPHERRACPPATPRTLNNHLESLWEKNLGGQSSNWATPQ